ncbi:hypothetical protein Tco_0460260, partial [Tanacetum coccineum]
PRLLAVVMVEMGEGAARGGVWSKGSERSGDGARFWCWPENPVGKVFWRWQPVAGGGGGLPEKMTLNGGERENLEESVCIYEMEMKEMK